MNIGSNSMLKFRILVYTFWGYCASTATTIHYIILISSYITMCNSLWKIVRIIFRAESINMIQNISHRATTEEICRHVGGRLCRWILGAYMNIYDPTNDYLANCRCCNNRYGCILACSSRANVKYINVIKASHTSRHIYTHIYISTTGFNARAHQLRVCIE